MFGKKKKEEGPINALNETVDITSTASFGMRQGAIYVGNKGIEFYDYKSKRNYVQIPWTEIEQIRAHVLMGGKYIRGLNVDTKKYGSLVFLVSNCRDVLRAIQPYLPADRLLRMKTMTSRVKDVFKGKNSVAE